MSFVMHTVASILRGSPSRLNNANDDTCHKHPNRCCHRADSLARNSFSDASFECMNDDLSD